MSDLKKIKEEFLLKLNKKLDVSEINEIKSNLFGKNGLSKCGIKIDRKILAEIAYDSPEAFKTIVQKAQSALN